MSRLFSIIYFIKKNLTISNINSTFINLYKKLCNFYCATSKMVKEMYEKTYTETYKSFAWRVCKRLLRVIGWSWGAFGTTFTYLYFVQGLSLLIEGYSGTMNEIFETKWLILSIQVGGFVFFALLIITIYESIRDFKKTHHESKMPVADAEFVTLATFNKKLTNINARLNNIERSLSILIEGASHAEATETTKTKTAKSKTNKKEKTSEA